MSTCSTATSARRGHDIRRRLFRGVNDDATTGHQLETRLRDLERDWHAYKAGRSGALRHRRSRSATGTPSSAVTAAAPDDDLSVFLRCSSRRLVNSLEHNGSGDGADSAGAVSVKGGQLQLCDNEDDASSVGSVRVKNSKASPSSCSCPRHCAALRRCHSTSSSSTVVTEPSSPPAEGDVVVTEDTLQTEKGKCGTGNNKVNWFIAIAFVVAMGVIVAMAVMGLDTDDEFLVPT